MRTQHAPSARFRRLRQNVNRSIRGAGPSPRVLEAMRADQQEPLVPSAALDRALNRRLLGNAVSGLWEPGIDSRQVALFRSAVELLTATGQVPCRLQADDPQAVEGLHAAAHLLTDYADAGHPSADRADVAELLRRIARAHCRYASRNRWSR